MGQHQRGDAIKRVPLSRRLVRGMLAGFLATVALTAVILILRVWSQSIVPPVNPVRLLGMALRIEGAAVPWSLHFFIGTFVWGCAFAALCPSLPGPCWIRGVLFGTGAWVSAMLLALPVAGTVSLIAQSVSLILMWLPVTAPEIRDLVRPLTLPLAMLALHWIYGAALGATYGALAALRRPACGLQPPQASGGADAR